jgi:hypothetical protein
MPFMYIDLRKTGVASFIARFWEKLVMDIHARATRYTELMRYGDALGAARVDETVLVTVLTGGADE